LYNWYAVIDPRGLAPEGWHVPSQDEWLQLLKFLGGNKQAAIKMRAPGIAWRLKQGSNESGFSAFPGGLRTQDGVFTMGEAARWWSSDAHANKDKAISYDMTSYERCIQDVKELGLSVRCVKD
jgi:uncharacterized protein (TIGR02145 family)